MKFKYLFVHLVPSALISYLECLVKVSTIPLAPARGEGSHYKLLFDSSAKIASHVLIILLVAT